MCSLNLFLTFIAFFASFFFVLFYVWMIYRNLICCNLLFKLLILSYQFVIVNVYCFCFSFFFCIFFLLFIIFYYILIVFIVYLFLLIVEYIILRKNELIVMNLFIVYVFNYNEFNKKYNNLLFTFFCLYFFTSINK